MLVSSDNFLYRWIHPSLGYGLSGLKALKIIVQSNGHGRLLSGFSNMA